MLSTCISQIFIVESNELKNVKEHKLTKKMCETEKKGKRIKNYFEFKNYVSINLSA